MSRLFKKSFISFSVLLLGNLDAQAGMQEIQCKLLKGETVVKSATFKVEDGKKVAGNTLSFKDGKVDVVGDLVVDPQTSKFIGLVFISEKTKFGILTARTYAEYVTMPLKIRNQLRASQHSIWYTLSCN